MFDSIYLQHIQHSQSFAIHRILTLHTCGHTRCSPLLPTPVFTPQYPQSSACRRIPLDFTLVTSAAAAAAAAAAPAANGEGGGGGSGSGSGGFSSCLDAYVRPYLRKGVPSLFVDLRPLYK